MPDDCVLALDLGTTAFKAAPVRASGVCGRVTTVPYSLDYGAEQSVTCDPERYVRCAFRALRSAARVAREQGMTVRGVGISSQAQTFIPIDAHGVPVAPAVVWTDARPAAEAEEVGRRLPDYAETCGFVRPSPLQFLPKLMRFHREGRQASRFLLLNEWVAYNLTGECFGDTCVQGMGGLYDIARQGWNEGALALAGVKPGQLAAVSPAPGPGVPMTRAVSRALGLRGDVPVYTCGNDQSCAAIGAGVEDEKGLFANFGTALVVYALKERPTVPAGEDQIAGISPLNSKWFLLGVESECGNVIEWMAGLLYRRGGVARLIDEALRSDVDVERLPEVALAGGGVLDMRRLRVDSRPAEMARALLERYSARFGALLAMTAPGRPGGLFVGGGLSRSRAWLDFLAQRHGVALTPTEGEHPGLVGVARIIERGERQT